MNATLARVLVAGSSGAVLVLEILAGRLLAPYVGVSLETFTGIIGVVLAGIAAGAWAGGALADHRDATPMIGAALALGGGLCWLVLPILGALGQEFGAGTAAILILSTCALFLPAAVLSAISPMVAKLRLASLDDTGAVVGGLSAAGTLGALAGTFLTGFVFVSALPTRATVLVMGAVLVIWGAVTHVMLTKARPTVGAAALVLLGGGLGLVAGSPCQHATNYFCANIVVDPDDASARSLYLDGLRHAYVDFDDPTHLDIRYIRLFAQIGDSLPDGPLDSLHIGGGGFSFPRYLQHERPGSTDLVLEIDGALVDLAERELALEQTAALDVQVGDARLALGDLATDRFDYVLGDAFASRAVPWHLTTREFLAEVDRVMAPTGIYAMNVIDGGDFGLVRAELATLAETFAHVQFVEPAEGLPPQGMTNLVLIASQSPLPAFALDPADGVLRSADEVTSFIDGASALRDDYAPVDQLQG